MSCGSHWVNGELARWILQSDVEDGVDAGVGVLDLHVEVGQGCSDGSILQDGHPVLCLVEGGSLVIDVSDGDGDVSS